MMTDASNKVPSAANVSSLKPQTAAFATTINKFCGLKNEPVVAHPIKILGTHPTAQRPSRALHNDVSSC